MSNLDSSPVLPANLEPLDPLPLNEDGGLNLLPSMLALADGGYILTWTHATAEVGVLTVRMQRFDSYGDRVGDMVEITQGALVSGITEFDNGGLVVTYAVKDEATEHFNVFYQLYNEDLTAAGSAVMVNTAVDTSQNFASVWALAGDRFAVTWIADNGDHDGLYIRTYDSDGDPLTAPDRLSDVFTDTLLTQLIRLEDGSYLVT